MVAGSILPVTMHNGKVYFLFGKENALADTPGFSDFGGGVENDEAPFETALREGGEELTGFLGDSKTLREHINNRGGFYKILNKTYHMHVIYLDYDKNLPKYFNQNHDFLWKRMDQKMLNDTKLFEKSEIDWFSVADMKRRKKEFRNFYQEITSQIVKEVPAITKHFKSQMKSKASYNSNRHTKKMRGGM
jgi:hypothetical protein